MKNGDKKVFLLGFAAVKANSQFSYGFEVPYRTFVLGLGDLNQGFLEHSRNPCLNKWYSNIVLVLVSWS